MTTTHLVILDFEATCDEPTNPDPQEIIEFPSVLVDVTSRSVVDEFASFVRPVHHPISPFCTQLTSITQEDVAQARPFAEVFAAHQAWLTGHGLSADNALLVTCGDWDLARMLPAQLRTAGLQDVRPIYRHWTNLKVPFAAQTGARAGMAGMLRTLDLPLVGHHHRGIDDCRNLARIAVALLERGLEPAPTSALAIKAWPPLTLDLVHADQVTRVTLSPRTFDTLIGQARKASRSTVRALLGPNGPVTQTQDLHDLPSGARLLIT